MLSGALGIVAFCVGIYGIYRGFVASVVLGIILIFVPPAALVVGILKLCGYDAPEQIMVWWRSRG